MVTKMRIAALVAAATMSVTSPVLAQSPHQHRRTFPQINSRSGRQAFARVPGTAPFSPDPAMTGGGSPSDPVNNPMTSGGGSMGYNKYMGHAH
jgi:hypothetical protein